MRPVARAFYRNPIVFLGVVQGGATALAAAEVVTAWVPLVTLAIVTPIQRHFVKPMKKGRP